MNTRKRILFVDLGASMAGVEAYLEGLTEILQPNADLFAICVLEELGERLTTNGVRVTRLPLFAKVRALRFIVAFFALCYLIGRYRISTVQVNGFLEATLLVPARLLGCETVYTRHGPFEVDLFPWHKQPAKFFPRFLARQSARFASQLVCVSETVGSTVKGQFAASRVKVISNWLGRLPEFRARFAKAGEDLVHVVYVGRLEQYKGVQLLLEAVRGLPVRLTIVGDGSYRRSLEEQSAGLNVTFTGFQRQTERFYDNADIFVMPSMGPEGGPMVALEAMSHSLPCIFSDLPVHCEITANGEAAMLFHNGDAADLRAKLTALGENAEMRKQYCEAAYRMVTAKYQVDCARRAYLQVFEVGV